jgi:hypothetical protein
MAIAIPQNPCMFGEGHERALVLEDPGLPSWPIRLGAAGMRDMAAVRWKRDTPGLGSLHAEIGYSISPLVLTTYRIEISDGIIRAIYDMSVQSLRPADEPIYFSETDDKEVMPSQRTERFLSLDRHAWRIDELLDAVSKFDRESSGIITPTLLDGIGFRKPRSRRGCAKLVHDDELKRLESEKLPIESIAERLGVKPKAIYEHRRRRRIEEGS